MNDLNSTGKLNHKSNSILAFKPGIVSFSLQLSCLLYNKVVVIIYTSIKKKYTIFFNFYVYRM